MTTQRNDTQNADKLQSVISDDLFPQVQHISDVKQVIEEMKSNAQNLREPQIKALLLLKELGSNEYLHGKNNPYDDLYKYIVESGKKDVADPEYYNLQRYIYINHHMACFSHVYRSEEHTSKL